MQLPQLLAATALAALATALVTDSSPNCHKDQVAILDRQDPVVGDPCSRNEECAANSGIYCSPQQGTCQERSFPGDPCENSDACFQGECRGNVCGGKPKGSPCRFLNDCADPLICRPELIGDRGYEFQCLYRAPDRDFGARCRSDSDCGFPFYCVITEHLDHYCGINQDCVEKGSRCSTNKDCCPPWSVSMSLAVACLSIGRACNG